MLRMTLALAAAIYVGLVVWGDPVTEAMASTDAAPAIDTDLAVAAALGPEADPDQPVILSDDGPQVTRAATRTVVPEASVVAAGAGQPMLVSLIPAASEPAAPATVEAASDAAGDGPRLRVSGSVVNLRSGPSTANPVVAALPEGTLTEPLGEAQGGWIEIRAIEGGATGFMAARFLEPA